MTGTNAYSVGRIMRSMRWFAVGKIVSAPLSFLLVLVLTAKMSTVEYAAYVAAIAVLEIGVAVGTMGIDWLTQTAVAGIRVRGSTRELRRAVLALSALAVLPYALLSCALWFGAPLLSEAMGGVTSVEVLRLYAVVLLIEGTTRMHRDNLLAVLMVQGAVQISQISRVITMFIGIATVLAMGITIDAVHVAKVEIGSALFSMVVTLFTIARHTRLPTDGSPDEQVDISRYFGREQMRFAAHAYSSFMFTILISAEVTTALIARYLGADATATFGFIWKLLETGRRLLPMDLFYSVIRPATIGRFKSSDGDKSALVRESNLFLKANLLVLGAGTAIALGVGDWLVGTLSHGNVLAPPLLMAALLGTAYGHSMRRTVELIAFVSGNSDLFLKASFCCVLSPILLFVLLPSAAGNLYMVAAVLIAVDTLFCAIVIGGLRMRFGELSMDFRTWFKLAFASTLGGGVAAMVIHYLPGTAGSALAGALSIVAYFAAVMITEVLTRTELDYIRFVVRPKAS